MDDRFFDVDETLDGFDGFDGEMEGDFDEFFGKKARKRRKLRRKLRKEGLSRKEARKLARDVVKGNVADPTKSTTPTRTESSQAVRTGAGGVVTPKTSIASQEKRIPASREEMSEYDADVISYETDTDVVVPTGRSIEADANEDAKKPNFLLIGGIVLAVAVGGFFLLKK